MDDKIHIASYLDLWSGFLNQYTTIYSNDGQEKPFISGIKGLDLLDSKDLWFVNSKNTIDSGVLNWAHARTSAVNGSKILSKALANQPGNSVVTSDDYIFFTTYDQVYAYDPDNDSLSLKTIGFKEARGICYGDEKLFVADHKAGLVYKLKAEDDGEEITKPWMAIPGVYGVHCVDAAGILAAISLLVILYF
jgi:hypothetical protein